MQQVEGLYSMPFSDYLDSFNWQRYLDAVLRDYNIEHRGYKPVLRFFSSRDSRTRFLNTIAQTMATFRQRYNQQQLQRSLPKEEEADMLF